jgi:hypothetical protein
MMQRNRLRQSLVRVLAKPQAAWWLLAYVVAIVSLARRVSNMSFRWIMMIALWTSLSGPIFSRPALPARSAAQAKPGPRRAKVAKPAVSSAGSVCSEEDSSIR